MKVKSEKKEVTQENRIKRIKLLESFEKVMKRKRNFTPALFPSIPQGHPK